MDISVVIPLFSEEESIPELSQWIVKVMNVNKFSYEVIFVDDGSRDNSWNIIEQLSKENNNIKGIKFRRNYGKSAALNCGFQEAQGDVVITMDSDLQDSPDEIPELFKMIKEQGFQLVSGWKKKRYDPITKTIPTKLFNAAARKASGIKLHDFNCGLKAYRKDVVKTIEVYGEMHRYIPVIAKWAGFTKIGEKIVLHQKRKYGKSKFGLSRFINGFLDLMTISFMGKFGKRPMHLFGLWGTFLFLIGFGIAAYLAYAKIALATYKMTERPLFYLGMLCMLIGSQMFLTGFLAEMISRNSTERNHYVIEKKITN
ncbi:MAG TPA: glycosyltransferase family 2 protein [Bacteroidales bacterium]|nr:glycosyltransferase family 2 protein [Bacteroidales bacterium]HQH18441.1 glycosyltransferase family 2 protein [Bacteroidales bacterium]HQI45123.1 glycosyltransferase family 2 protein [Bacteroidales bacterium]